MPGFGLVVTKSGHLARHFRQMLASRPDSALTRALRGSLAQQIVFVNGRIAKSSGWWHAITGPFLQRLAQGREPFLKPRPPFLALCKAH